MSLYTMHNMASTFSIDRHIKLCGGKNSGDTQYCYRRIMWRLKTSVFTKITVTIYTFFCSEILVKSTPTMSKTLMITIFFDYHFYCKFNYLAFFVLYSILVNIFLFYFNYCYFLQVLSIVFMDQSVLCFGKHHIYVLN